MSVKKEGFLRSRADPFAHIGNRLIDEYGWKGSLILDAIKRGACPLCESQDLVLHHYLLWLPANLRDPDFFRSLGPEQGFCPEHIESIMESLEKSPYGLVQFFRLILVQLKKGRQPGSGKCSVCSALLETTRADRKLLEELQAGMAKEGRRKLNPRLCRLHSRPPTALPDRRMARDSGLLLRQLMELENKFHLMEMDELRATLEMCKLLIRQAIEFHASTAMLI